MKRCRGRTLRRRQRLRYPSILHDRGEGWGDYLKNYPTSFGIHRIGVLRSCEVFIVYIRYAPDYYVLGCLTLTQLYVWLLSVSGTAPSPCPSFPSSSRVPLPPARSDASWIPAHRGARRPAHPIAGCGPAPGHPPPHHRLNPGVRRTTSCPAPGAPWRACRNLTVAGILVPQAKAPSYAADMHPSNTKVLC